MQKNLFPYLSTSRFARLCGTNKRTLFHYDDIGLLPPERTDEKGYRYYTQQQYLLFQIITVLKRMGMQLGEIKRFIEQRDPGRFEALLAEQDLRIGEQIEQLTRMKQLIRTRQSLLREAQDILPEQFELPFFEQLPQAFLIRSEPVDSDEHDRFTRILYEHLSYCEQHRFQEGFPFGAMISRESLEMNNFKKYAYFFTQIHHPADDPHLFCRPAGTYACLYLRGDYREPQPAYQRLLQFFRENHLTMGDYSYKEGIIDETAQQCPDRLITKILIPVSP